MTVTVNVTIIMLSSYFVIIMTITYYIILLLFSQSQIKTKNKRWNEMKIKFNIYNSNKKSASFGQFLEWDLQYNYITHILMYFI